MGARRPSFRFGRRIGLWLGRRVAPGGGVGGAVLLSAAIAADGYTIDLTYDTTPPTDANYTLSGTPEFVVGASVVGFVRTLRVSGPILDNETVAITSNTLSGQATTNSSTESGSDYTTNRLVELDARTGLTHTGDGTTITAANDQSGNAYNFGEIETGQGPVYRAAIAQMRSLPMIDCANNDALQATAAGLLTALSGNISWTYVLLWCPSGNNNNSRVCSWGIKNNASNQFVDVGSITTACNSTSTQTGNANNRTTNNLDQWQKKPLPTMTAWVCNGSTITMYAGQTNVTYDSSTFSAVVGLVPTALALGARLQAVAPTYSNGSFRFARARLYNAALTAAQLRRVGRAFAAGYGVSMLGCSPARALSLV